MTNVVAATLDETNSLTGTDNAAWASINTPLNKDELLAFCLEDVERLFRINPYLEFEHWESLGQNYYSFSGRNFSQEQPFNFKLEFKVEALEDGLRLHYVDGLKRETHFKIEASDHGSKLTIHESYSSITEEEQEQEEKLAEVDRSLTTWAGDIQKYLIIWKQWRWLGPWRWYMRWFWQKMKPSGRRIAYMFWWITLVEIVLIILGAGIYWVEYA